MGFFDAIGKALNDSMANDDKLGKKENPGFRVRIFSVSSYVPKSVCLACVSSCDFVHARVLMNTCVCVILCALICMDL